MIGLYSSGELYDFAFGHYADDLPFYLALAKQRHARVALELFAGTGRVSLPLARSGLDVTALEISAALIRTGRAKSQDAGLKINWVKGDASNFRLRRKFDLVLAPFNSVQHLKESDALLSCFKSVLSHLAPKGVFAFDVSDLGCIYPRQGSSAKEVLLKEREVRVEVELHYDEPTQVWQNSLTYKYAAGLPDRTDVLEIRAYYPKELEFLLRLAGFRKIRTFGDFRGKPYSRGDEKTIFVCSPN